MRKSEEILKWLQSVHSISVLFNQHGEYICLDKESLTFPIGEHNLETIRFYYDKDEFDGVLFEVINAKDMDNASIKCNNITVFNRNGQELTISVFSYTPLLIPKNVCNPQT